MSSIKSHKSVPVEKYAEDTSIDHADISLKNTNDVQL